MIFKSWQAWLCLALGMSLLAQAHGQNLNVDATAKALRINNTITGGFMPTSDPLFQQMVQKVASGDLQGAAAIAAGSRYFAGYLGRRLALQMQSPALEATNSSDNDATAFILAHFIGLPGTPASLSTLWSENATYLLNINGTNQHAADLNTAVLEQLDWGSALVRVTGQTVLDQNNNPITLPIKHVGGYVTLSDRPGDTSFAMWGATAGTNLRMIEGIWEIATGLKLMDVASTSALAQDVPRFIPEYDPNFFQGQGQTACIACHGGGMASLNHGYATVADTFDYTGNGLTFIANPTNRTRKSLGSDPAKRAAIATCNLTANPDTVCNPDSSGIDQNQGWNVGVTWGPTGVLNTMGWTGPTSGQGLNELGIALGQARIVYEYLVKRVVTEVCPLGAFRADEITKMANAANPYAVPAGTDDIRTIVSLVASHPSCL
ncbi:MAG: hypothetical protein AB7F86_11630 [Bdellovibrionales bacterium]